MCVFSILSPYNVSDNQSVGDAWYVLTSYHYIEIFKSVTLMGTLVDCLIRDEAWDVISQDGETLESRQPARW